MSVMTMEHQEDKYLQKLESLAKSYVPEWLFSAESPDIGSAIALLYLDMFRDNEKKLDMLLPKHKIQYLNLFDGLKEEPIESAQSFVQFTSAPGTEEPVYIPAGTQVLADSDSTGSKIVFETTHSITASTAKLKAVYTSDAQSDVIVSLLDTDQGTDAEHCNFYAFDTSGENLNEHILLLCFAHAFDEMDKIKAALILHTADPDKAAPQAAKLAETARFVLVTQDGYVDFDQVTVENSAIQLTKRDYRPEKIDLNGHNGYVIGIIAKSLCNQEFSSIELSTCEEGVIPDEVRCGDMEQNVGHFQPFGSPMEIYAECGIESRRVFAQKGARIEFSFDLSFDIAERLLPESNPEIDYRVIMKKPAVLPKMDTMEVRPDYVLIEYLSGKGWRRLIKEEHVALLFNGSKTGRIAIEFVCPWDMLTAEEADGAPRLRLRLMRAENLYRQPVRQYCPVIDDLRLSYHYDAGSQKPQYASTRNNFVTENVTDLLSSGRRVIPYYNNEQSRPVMYLGFEGTPFGTPLSAYFDLENYAENPIDFTAEYLSPEGFSPLKVVDYTDGFLYSGTLQLLIPRDAAHKELFERDLFWVRLVNHNRKNEPHLLPVIHGVYLNMARVANKHTKTAYFYMDDPDSALKISLEDQNLIRMSVFVNEEDGTPQTENWVEWRRGANFARNGRVCRFDLANGEVEFEKGTFAFYTVKSNGPSIKVNYQSYQGADANVPEYKICTLNGSLRSISDVKNPMAAFGGCDGYSEESSAAMICNMLRTRKRVVTEQDFFDIISQVTYGVRRIKCRYGMNLYGQPDENAITVAILIEEFEKGGHIFSVIREKVREKLLECSSIALLKKQLNLTQPFFVRMSVRLWLECEKMENAYDLQRDITQYTSQFFDPLAGGFDGHGWEIGTLPTVSQLLAYLKIRQMQAVITRIVVTAEFGGREYEVTDDLYKEIRSPFAMAVNGNHVVYIDLAQ